MRQGRLPAPASLWVVALVACLIAGWARAEVTRVPSGTIVAANSGKCLDGGGAGAGAAVLQVTCQGAGSQQWTLQPFGGAYRILGAQSGLCLNVAGADLTPGGTVIQWPCVGAANELWAIQPVGGGKAVMLVSRNSGLCLNVSGMPAVNWTDQDPLIQWPCDAAAANEQFTFAAGLIPPDAGVVVQSALTGQCMNVSGANSAPGAPLIQWPCSGGDNDKWFFLPSGGTYQLVAKHSGQCLTVSGASPDPGAAVVQAPCGGADNQLWALQPQGKSYQLVARHSGQCLNVYGARSDPATALIQWPCVGTGNDTWALSPASLPSAWSAVIPLPVIPVGAANLPDGQILVWASNSPVLGQGDIGNAPSQTYSALFDPSSGTATQWVETGTLADMFCPGTAVLPDGRILLNGGDSSYKTSLYNPWSHSWQADALMNIPRGYPGDAVLPNGTVLTLGGSWSGGTGGKTGELWTTGGGWRILPGIPADPFTGPDPQGVFAGDNHLWLFARGDGRIFHAGPSAAMHWIDPAGAGTVTFAGLRGDDNYSINGNAVLYDSGKILKAGGAPAYREAPATAATYVIDLGAQDGNGNPTVRKTAPMASARAFSNGVLLPNGQVLIVGGEAYPLQYVDDTAVLTPELWDPDTMAFRQLAPMQTPRTYHSAAILQADGRVFVGGGGLCGSCAVNHANAEILTPPYLLNADGTPAARPAITSVSGNTVLGGTLTVTTDSPVAAFAMIRLSAVTHTVNNDQRRVPLGIQSTPARGSYVLSIPADPGLVLPGNYWLFALSAEGTPSLAQPLFVRLV